MKILITGASGLLGKSLAETAPNNATLSQTWLNNITGASDIHSEWYQLDTRNENNVYQVIQRTRPDVIIHCAAIGSVDYARSHYEVVYQVNVTGTRHVVDAANEIGVKVVFVSSNAVYYGDNPPYAEDAPLRPINDYGLIKMQGERYVRDVAHDWLIVRPFLLYGWQYPGGRGNWASTIVDRLGKGEEMKLVNDHIWQPTYAPDCAMAIWKLLEQGQAGIFNVAAPDTMTLYDFGLKVCEVFELDGGLLEPVRSSYFEGIAERPKDTRYTLGKLAAAGIELGGVSEGLKRMREGAK